MVGRRWILSAGVTTAILLALTPVPASAYEQNGAFTPGGSTTLPSGIVVSAPPPAVITSPRSGAAINIAMPTLSGTGEPRDTVTVRSSSLLCSGR